MKKFYKIRFVTWWYFTNMILVAVGLFTLPAQPTAQHVIGMLARSALFAAIIAVVAIVTPRRVNQ